MDHEIVLAALRLLTRVVEASKALLELLRHIRGWERGCEPGTRQATSLKAIKPPVLPYQRLS